MTTGAAALSLDDLKARAKAAGLKLTDAQLAEIYKGYVYTAAMATRVRIADRRPREAEPDLIFRAAFEE